MLNGWTLAFDLDGTLIDTAPDLIGAANHILGTLDLEPVPLDALRPTISFGSRNILIQALAMRGRRYPDAEIDALLERFLVYYEANIARHSRPFEQMVDCLERLSAGGARLVVCTNKLEHLSRRLLSELAVDGLFGAITGRDTFPVCKPDPGHLVGAIAKVGGDARRAIMVGDSEVDIATAKAAKVPVIAVTFGYPAVPVADLDPEAIVHHYSQMHAAVERLAAGGATPAG